MERLQKIIANSGLTSRRKAEELITNGKVKVNGEIVKELGFKAEINDRIEVDGKLLKQEKKVYYILNKPRGVITSSSDDKGRETVVDLIDTNLRIYPVGRLDYDTTGLVILTNDGDFANFLMHPKNNIDKVYTAKIEGILSVDEIMKLKNGVVIDGVKTSRSRVKVKKIDKEKDTSIVEITIHEGRNHQVKKMFDSVNHAVIKLKRERISILTLGNLKSGEYRKLSSEEIESLKRNISK